MLSFCARLRGVCLRFAIARPCLGDPTQLDHSAPVLDDAHKRVIKKQRHTAKRIFERLRDEHGYTGKLTIVTDYVREKKRRTKEVFVPLA